MGPDASSPAVLLRLDEAALELPWESAAGARALAFELRPIGDGELIGLKVTLVPAEWLDAEGQPLR